MEKLSKKNLNKLFSRSILILLVGIAFSCTGWDEYKEYTKDGEIIYPGKISSLDILSGKNRVRILGGLSPDTRVTEFRIFWNDREDSLVLDVTDQIRANGFDQIVDVQESLQTYILYTYDEFGNKSLPASKIGVSYGSNYQQKVNNRVVSSTFNTDTSTMLIWRPIDTSTGAQSVTVNYEVDGLQKSVETVISKDTTELKGLIVSETVSYYSTYVPDLTCIDLFYSDTTEYVVVR